MKASSPTPDREILKGPPPSSLSRPSVQTGRFTSTTVGGSLAISKLEDILYTPQKIERTPSSAMMSVEKVLNSLQVYPFKRCMAEIAQEIVRKLGWKC